jgi:hypothetical protein
MSQILVIAAAVFGINVLPAFGPPTWSVLAYFRITDGTPIWVLVVVGTLAAAAGRYVLAVGFRSFGSHLRSKRRESLEALGATLSGPRGLLGTMALFAVSPVPSNTLFEAAGLAHVRLGPLLTAFGAGRLVSYSVSLVSVSAAGGGIRHLITGGVSSPRAIALGILGLVALVVLVRVDWVTVIDRVRARIAHRNGEPAPASIREQLSRATEAGAPRPGDTDLRSSSRDVDTAQGAQEVHTMRPLSESLADMSVHAKSVEDRAAAAQQETHEQISARIQQSKADAQRRSEAAKARRNEVAHDITARWASLRADLRNQIDQIHDGVEERRDEHDAKVAQRHADRAEENAIAAIDFAQSVIDAADEAVLEAIDARAQAEVIAPAADARVSA